jgi:hypothetical protein
MRHSGIPRYEYLHTAPMGIVQDHVRCSELFAVGWRRAIAAPVIQADNHTTAAA